MMLSLLVALSVAQNSNADQIYAQSQRKLDALQNVRIMWTSGAEREVVHAFARPNKAIYYTYGDYGFRTNGKRVTYREDDGREVFRNYRDGDLERVALLGFESFYRPGKSLTPIGDAVQVQFNGRTCWRLQMPFRNRSEYLYIDVETLLPVGAGSLYYASVKGNAEFEPRYFAFLEPRPAKEVYERMRAMLAGFKGLTFGYSKGRDRGSGVWALRPHYFRQSDDKTVVVADGKRVQKRSAAGKVTSKPQVGWPHPWFPGLEGYFEPKLAARVTGTAEIAALKGEEVFCFRAAYPGRGTYLIYCTAGFVPTAYTVISGPNKGVSYHYNNVDTGYDFFANDPRMFVLDPPDPISLPPLGSR